MMIVVSIIGMLIAMVAPLIIQTQRFFILNRARVNIQREARSAMTTISKNLRQAQSLTIRLDNVTGQPYYSRIRFTTVDGRALTYYQSGTNLFQIGTSTSTLSTHVRFLNFFFPRTSDMSIVSISMTLEEVIYEGRKKALHVASERIRIMD
jgi:type II secretory pathway pseudopilin PulG